MVMAYNDAVPECQFFSDEPVPPWSEFVAHFQGL